MQQQTWTNPLLRLCAGLACALTLVACSTSKEEMLPHGEANMLDVW
ncbi:TIGR03751 family conjugal transfer lipoprotein, partial [Pseudomonas aeruginosa]